MKAWKALLILLAAGIPTSTIGNAAGLGTITEVGTVEHNGDHVTFDLPFTSPPNVIIGRLTYGRAQSCHPYAAQLTVSGFDYQSNCDLGYTDYVNGSWIAASAQGSPDSMTEVGEVANSGDRVTFDLAFPSVPKVVFTRSSFGNVVCHPAAVNLTTSGFNYQSNCSSGYTTIVYSGWVATLSRRSGSSNAQFHDSITKVGNVANNGDHVQFDSSFPGIPKIIFTRLSQGSGVACHPVAANLTSSGFDYQSNCSSGYTAIVYSGWVASYTR